MDTTQRELLMQRRHVIQYESLPEFRGQTGSLMPKLEKLIHTLEWVNGCGSRNLFRGRGGGHPSHERAGLDNAAPGLSTTAGLIERLTIDRALRRIRGWALRRKLPSEAAFSRAFEEFAPLLPPRQTRENQLLR